MSLLFLAAAWACDPVADIAAADRALQALDTEGASKLLEEAEADFRCAAISEQDLGRFWMASGIRFALDGEIDAAIPRFQAAKRAGASPDLSDYGEAVETAFADAGDEEGRMVLALATPLSKNWISTVDGQVVRSYPLELPAGLHLVQIHPKADRSDTAFARIVFTAADETARLDHALPDKPSGPAGGAVPFLGFGFGAELAAATETTVNIDGSDVLQPGSLWVIPAEVTIGVNLASTWWRIGGHVGPLLSGALVYENQAGTSSTGFVLSVEGAGGARLGRVQPGVAVGARLPSRIRLRGVLGIETLDNLFVEPSFGVHMLTLGGPEPIGLLALCYQLPLK